MSVSYCSITDVNSLVPQVPFTSNSVPTQAQVEGFILQISERLDATLENIGYITPVTGVKSLRLVKEAVAWGALGLAQQSRVTAIAPDQAVGLSVWTKQYEAWIKRLITPNDPFELPDAPRNQKEVVKPIGEMLASTTDLSNDEFDYGTNPPFYMGMKL